MKESKDPKSAESSAGNKSVESREPDSDATSSKTLSDIEETEKVSNKKGKAPDESERASVPSPDGAFDESRGGGRDDAGPM